MSLGSPAAFKWKAKSCSDSEASSCWLHHGDLLVMDGRCQDEYFHCTSPGLADRRINITNRWIRNHIPSCPLAAGVLGSLPTCAHGSSVLEPAWGNFSVPVWVLLGFLVILICGLLIVLFCRASCTSYHKEHLFFPSVLALGQFWRVWNLCSCWESWWSFNWTGNYGSFSGWFWRFDWLPCMLAWW